MSSEEAREAEGLARAQEIRADVAEAEARRAEEDRGEAESVEQQAEEKVGKLSRKERRAQKKAAKEAEKAEKARQRAEEKKGEANRLPDAPSADPARDEEPQAVDVSGARLASPGAGDQPEEWAAAAGTTQPEAPDQPQTQPQGEEKTWGSAPAPASAAASMIEDQRPEVLIGAAFAGAFLFAQLLKRIGD